MKFTVVTRLEFVKVETKLSGSKTSHSFAFEVEFNIPQASYAANIVLLQCG